MSEEITEGLLELHYHRAIVNVFALAFGARFLRMLKPSTQQETWVGFDQGWVNTSIPTGDLYNQLSAAISTGSNQLQGFHLGYFLQFKVVRTLSRRSHLSPSTFIAPYFRSELSVWPNPNTGLYQHETLCRLAQIEGALAYYACPLLFDVDKIYEYPDLDSLQVVDVRSAPPSIQADARHFIAFRDLSNVTPVWCSEPHPGRGRRASEWIRDEILRPRRRTGLEVLELIDKVRYVLAEEPHGPSRRRDARAWMPRSFTVLSFSV
jgi:hypothetical protein